MDSGRSSEHRHTEPSSCSSMPSIQA